ncbi:hypothetical protein [Aeoliella sp.]|uniref:hypothetical protein n=1 Tax=Aeoliella sp. TaxID=2795800 RepID=UPI003CCB9974
MPKLRVLFFDDGNDSAHFTQMSLDAATFAMHAGEHVRIHNKNGPDEWRRVTGVRHEINISEQDEMISHDVHVFLEIPK